MPKDQGGRGIPLTQSRAKAPKDAPLPVEAPAVEPFVADGEIDLGAVAPTPVTKPSGDVKGVEGLDVTGTEPNPFVDDFDDEDLEGAEDLQGVENLEGVGDVEEGLDPDSLNMFSVLLKRDPALSDKIADVIMEHYKGEQGMYDDFDNLGGGDFGGAGAPDVGQASLGTGTQGTPNMSPEMLERLERLEQGYAHTALERELAETSKEYETLRSQFPILPDLNEQEILQIALDKGALPLSDALTLWAMQQMRTGDGSPTDRIVAAAMASGKGKNLPSPEGKGGVAPAAEGAQPENLREARSMARDRIRALFGSGPG